MMSRSFHFATSMPSSPDANEKPDRQQRPTRRQVYDYKGRLPPSHPQSTHTAPISAPPSAPSKPVAVPPRAFTSRKGPTTRQSSAVSGNGLTSPPSSPHDHTATRPSVAALLAMTQIPLPRKTSRKLVRELSLPDLLEEWNSMDVGDSTPLSTSPTMGLLLSPPDQAIMMERSTSDEDMSGRLCFPSRSVSNESMPSLDSDAQSVLSSGIPQTPLMLAKSGKAERKGRYMSSPPGENCATDHPLLPSTFYESPTSEPRRNGMKTVGIPKQPMTWSKSSFRSNLTASFEAIKSAATSLSNYSAPSIPPDDFLSRSLFSPTTPLRSEMRPRFFAGTPPAELRRYLNPDPPSWAGTPLDFHLHNSHIDQTDLCAVATASGAGPASVIQMQTYSRRKSKRRPSQGPSLDLTEAGRAMNRPGLRDREPRENSEFLRVCVLEMNMRRVGKLDPKAGFRAQFWLPPRRASVQEMAVRHDGEVSQVPLRWQGIAAADL